MRFGLSINDLASAHVGGILCLVLLLLIDSDDTGDHRHPVVLPDVLQRLP
jgi:hypothetical protein